MLERRGNAPDGHVEEFQRRQTPGGASTGIGDIRGNYEQQTARGTIPSTPGRGPDTYQRIRRTFAEHDTQTDSFGQIDWRTFDANKALRNLASVSSRIRLLTLRRLH
eukprot:6488016-Amphidinium_carterae.1